MDVHVVSHTHWDREWYLPHERFRQRLIALVDELIDDPPLGRESFLLDGQAIVVEDYLAVRPERRDALVALLQSGRVEAGLWYVLADELIPAGESLVRNLLTGRRILSELKAVVPPVLYCPDSFGHPAALPAIAAGFGLSLILLWRGYGGARWPSGDTVRWAAPSGESVVVFHLPRDGYEFGSHLPEDDAAAEERWQRMRAELVGRSTTGVLLVQNGADHHARQANARAAIAALERAGQADGVHRSSLAQFADALLRRSEAQPLPVVRGELRDSYGYTWTLQGTFATRAHEKRLNALAERQLLREAEPWAALAAVRGTSRRPLMNAAWQALLSAHPHDTLCGCSIDEVAAAMERRVRSATNQARGIRDDAIADLTGHDPVAARTARDAWQPIVQVRNPAPRARSGVAIVEIEEFIADVPVGPASASAAPIDESAVRVRTPKVPALGALQLLSRSVENRRIESPRHYPDNDLVSVSRVAAWVPDVPAYGVASYLVGAGEPARSGPRAPVRVTRDSMRNANIAVRVDSAGVVSLEHLASGRRIETLLTLVDEIDVGDLYTPAPRPGDAVPEFRGARMVHRGPLRGELALRYAIRSGSRHRFPDATVVVRLALDADAEFLRIGIDGENRADNHRIRLRIATGVVPGEVWAEAAFGVVRREQIIVSPADARTELPPRTAPLHRYVSVFDHGQGATVFSDGLGEYEAGDDGSITVTLLRAVGELSRNDLPERPGHAGWPTPTPGAQCHGPFAAEFAIMLHGPRVAETIDAIERAADDVLLPLVGETRRAALHLPPPVRGLELEGEGLAFSALKESEDGAWLVARCINLRDDEVAGRWRFPFTPTEARLARLDETPTSALEISGDAVVFQAAPHAIVTLLVSFADLA